MDLDETYERILLSIDREKRKRSIRLLQCLAFSRRPLRVKELAEVLAIRFDAGQIPRLHVDERSEKPDEDVLLAGSTLITTIKPDDHDDDDSDTRVVQFSHYSVIEFLTSERLAGSKNGDLSQYYIPPDSAHTTLAQCCIGTLLQLDSHIGNIVHSFPLAKYAAENWHHHAQHKDVAPRVQNGINCLFHPDTKYFAAWVSMHNIDPVPSYSRLTEPPRSSEPSPLYYATLYGYLDVVEYLIKTYQQDPNKSRGGRGTPLQAAVVLGHIEIANFLLEHNADVNARDKYIPTPLHIAVESGNRSMIQLLINHRADMNALEQGFSPLHMALRSKKFDVAELLVKGGADVNVRDKFNLTPLYNTLEIGKLETAQLLLDHGADVNALDHLGDALLHKALRFQKFDIVEFLVKGGADVNLRDRSNSTPLHDASGIGNLDVAQLLLSHRADVNAVDHRGGRPLHKALRFQKFDVVELLVKSGADVNVRDKSNSTPLHDASGIGSRDIAQLLLSHHADVNAVDHWGDCPLHKALRFQKFDVIELLVKSGADVNVRDKSNSTPLHDALGIGNFDIILSLLNHRADVNALNYQGHSPLYKAVQFQKFDVIELLIMCGADLIVRNKSLTPLHEASRLRNHDLTQLELSSNVNERGWRHNTLLYLTPFKKPSDQSRLSITHEADVDAQNDEDRTPMLARAPRELTQFPLNNDVPDKNIAGTPCIKPSVCIRKS